MWGGRHILYVQPSALFGGAERQVAATLLYEEQAAKLGLGDRLEFLGMVPDMRQFDASLDMLILPSRSEGSPNVV